MVIKSDFVDFFPGNLGNYTPKAVVINEAITLAKKYCDDNSYKLLNGVLDQL